MFRLTKWLSVAIITSMAFVVPSVAQTTPAPGGLTASGIADNNRLSSETPQLCWTPIPGQQDFQIQVGDNPNLSCSGINGGNCTTSCDATAPNCCSEYFYDSGPNSSGNPAKSTADGAKNCWNVRNVYLCSMTPSYNGISLDRRLGAIYWRVRVKANGVWGPFSDIQKIHMSTIPEIPKTTMVTESPSGDIDPFLDYGVVNAAPVTQLVDAAIGVDSSDCTVTPCLTIAQAAKNATPGDTIDVAAGTYTESLLINLFNGYKSGTPLAPITLQAHTGDEVIWKATDASLYAVRFGNVTDWILTGGFKFGGNLKTTDANGAAFVDVFTGSYIAIDNVTEDASAPQADPTVDRGQYALVRISGGSHVRVTDSTFDAPTPLDQIELMSGNGVEIRNNTFSDCYTNGRCIQSHGVRGVNISGNNFGGFTHTRAEGMIFLYRLSESNLINNNVFHDITGGTNSVGIFIHRSSQANIINNTFYNVAGTCIAGSMWNSAFAINGNIFSGCGTAIGIRTSQQANATFMSDINWNVFFNSAVRDFDFNSNQQGNGASFLAIYDPSPSSGSTPFAFALRRTATGNVFGVDPAFVDAGSGDFHIQVSSGALNLSSELPLPEFLSTTSNRYHFGSTDAGAFEYDSEEPHTAEADGYVFLGTVEDSSPQLSWTFSDIDFNLWPFMGTGANPVDQQGRYQVQVDPDFTFDSVSAARPLIDSGPITSVNNSWTVPNGILTPGERYYWRVRVTDANDLNGWTAWSFPARFRVSTTADDLAEGEEP